MKTKKILSLFVLLLVTMLTFGGKAWSEARDDVVAYAEEVLNYEWDTEGGNVLLYYSLYDPKNVNGRPEFHPNNDNGYDPRVATGKVRGVPYTLSSNGGGGEEVPYYKYKNYEISKRLELSSIYTYSPGASDYGGRRISMKYGMSCATFVTECILQGLDKNMSHISHTTRFHGSSYWSQYISQLSSYAELQKGDYLDNGGHVMLVVDNNPNDSSLTVIEQTPTPDSIITSAKNVTSIYLQPYGYYDGRICNTYYVGTIKRVYSYGTLSNRSYDPMRVNYGDDIPDLPWNGSNYLTGITRDNYTRVYTRENREYHVFSDKYLEHDLTYPNRQYWTDGSEEAYLIGVGRNYKDVCYGHISIPTKSGREEVYVNLFDTYITGNLSEYVKAIYGTNKYYRRRGNDPDTRYTTNAGDYIFRLTEDNGWSQIAFWDNNEETGGLRIAWLETSEYLRIITDNNIPPKITTESLEKAVVGNKYSQTLSATGTTPITWEISGTLPPGLSFDKGEIYGEPTSTTNAKNAMYDTYRFDVIASNAAGSDRKTLGILLYETPSITTGTKLPDAYINEEYGVEISATGSAFGMRWSLKNGSSLPSGLQFEKSNSNRIAKITGKPTVTGTFSFTVQLQSLQISKTVEKTFNLTIYDSSKLEIVPSTIPEAIVGKPYTATLKFKGGEIGALIVKPTELFYSQGREFNCSYSGSDIKITGTPRYARNVTITINACNSDYTNLREIFQDFTLKVIKPEIEGTLKKGTAVQPYNSSFSANWPSTSYTWSRSGTLPSGLSVSYSGANATISGTPTSTGTFPFSLTVKDADNFSVTRSFNLTIAPIPSIIGSLSNGTTGSAYTGTVNVTDGVSPYTWSFTGNLPNGISPSYSGAKATISGTTQQTGTYNFTLKVEDINGASATKEFKNISFYKNPSVSGTFKNSGTVDTTYSSSVYAIDGHSPYKWTLVSGSLPPGLTLSDYGTYYKLSDRPTKAGDYSFTIKLTDTDGRSVTKDYTVKISDKPVISGMLSDSTEGVKYSNTVTVSGGAAPYTWSYYGTLPTGLSFSYSGNKATLSGTPNKAGTYNFSLQVVDNNDAISTKFYTVIIAEKIAINNSTLSSGTKGTAYSSSIKVSGGMAPYTWSYEGTLPNGLDFSYSGATATISGNPEKAGTYNFTLTVRDKNGAVSSKDFTIIIAEAMKFNSQKVYSGCIKNPYYDSVKVSGGMAPYEWKYTGKLPQGLEFTFSGNEAVLSGTPEEAGEYDIVITVTDQSGASEHISPVLKITKPNFESNYFSAPILVNQSYSSEYIRVTGGMSPYKWESAGIIPPGLKTEYTDCEVKLHGTPTEAGKYEFTLTAIDKNNASVSKIFTVTVCGFKGTLDDEGILNAKYDSSVTYINSASDYNLSYTGTIPEGLEFNFTGTTARLTGIPKEAGTFTFTLTATGKNDETYSKEFKLTITEPAISGNLVASGVVNKPYSSSLTISGGTSPYTWTSPTNLPDGLSFTSSGATATISGTPTKAGTFTFTLKVTDANGTELSENFSIKIKKPTIKGTLTKSGIVKKSYSSAITISDGTSPYEWTKSSGTLPAGLKLSTNSTGTKLYLKGTPTTAKSYTFTLKATDKNGATASKKFTVTITKPVISGDIVASGVVKKSYSSTLTISGGTSPYTWAKSSGTLPAGLKLSTNSTGTKLYLKGTPTTAKAYTFTLKATDKNGATASKKFTVTITKPTISGDIKASGVIKKSYSSSVSISGGTSPYTWAKSSGTLPTGLKLSTNSTGTKLYLKGTPTTAKAYIFTLKATDKNGATASKKFTVTITKPTISGDLTTKGVIKKSYSSSISISGGTSPYIWAKSSGTLPAGLKLSTNSSGTKLYLKGTPTTAKAYTFTLKATDKNGVTVSKKFIVTITKPTISGTLTDSGTVKSSYSSSISVSKGTSPYKWVKSKGTLPAGLKLSYNSTGTKLYLKGTPTTAKAYTFTLKVTDKNGATASKEFKVTIAKANTNKSGESVDDVSNTKDLSGIQDVIIPDSPASNETESTYMPPTYMPQGLAELKISGDILWQGEGKDEDLIGVQANEPLTFIIENAPSDMQVIIDDKATEGIEIDEGSFTLPAEFVSDDFKVRAENEEIETNEILISVEN